MKQITLNKSTEYSLYLKFNSELNKILKKYNVSETAWLRRGVIIRLPDTQDMNIVFVVRYKFFNKHFEEKIVIN